MLVHTTTWTHTSRYLDTFVRTYKLQTSLRILHKVSACASNEYPNKPNIPASILHKSIAGRYRPVRVADGPITDRYRFIENASWDIK